MAIISCPLCNGYAKYHFLPFTVKCSNELHWLTVDKDGDEIRARLWQRPSLSGQDDMLLDPWNTAILQLIPAKVGVSKMSQMISRSVPFIHKRINKMQRMGYIEKSGLNKRHLSPVGEQIINDTNQR